MASSDRELRLGLSGRKLLFPEGAPFCLVCGRRPFGVRVQAFKDVDYAERRTETANMLLRRLHPILAWANRARLIKFKIEAPVCFRHYWRGRGLDFAVVVLFLLALTGMTWLGFKGKLPSESDLMGSLLKGLLVTIIAVPGFFIWRRSRGAIILPCQARRESPESVVLVYDSEAPHPK